MFRIIVLQASRNPRSAAAFVRCANSGSTRLSNRSSMSRTPGRHTSTVHEANARFRICQYPLRYPLRPPSTVALRYDFARPPRNSVTSASRISWMNPCVASLMRRRALPGVSGGAGSELWQGQSGVSAWEKERVAGAFGAACGQIGGPKGP